MDLLAGLAINSLKITGYRGAFGGLFRNSNIAAHSLGTISLRDATLNNFPDTNDDDEPDDEREPFGVTGNTVNRLSLKQGRTKYAWSNGAWLNGLVPLDLEVRLA